jgi:hypothetical protein
MKVNNILMFSPEHIERNYAAERERVLSEVKYQMCLGALNHLLKLKKLTPEEFARAEKRIALRYRTMALHL